ncbi:MAG TPA: Rne/Rng family ribonuclease [Candidatus Kapabacteria bacterium]|nr:Rne/Rng family ribonuclease [Candidatus Kapabacteria bacterium]
MIRLRKEIFINAISDDEVRIAITENDRLVELFVETPETERHVGDIYLGKVAKVIPGMNAAFVNVGLEQDAFLHFSDIGDSFSTSSAYLSGEDAEMEDDDVDDEEDDYLVEEGATGQEQKIFRPRDRQPRGPRPERGSDRGDRNSDRSPEREGGPARKVIGADGIAVAKPMDLKLANQRDMRPRAARGNDRNFPTLLQSNVSIEPGQNILVQVTREAFANKGVRVTSRISIPGRFLVLVPFEPGIGISRKVYSVRERSRLRRIIRSLKPRELGVIIRTVAENKEESALREDLQKLLDIWKEIETKIKDIEPPTLVYQDSSITSSVMRDLFSPDVSRIVIDSKKMYREVMEYVEWAAPNLTGAVEQYKASEPMFDSFDIEHQIESSLSRKIPLPSGGYLFIEHTEAMVVIDVNSGRYAARREQELNSLKTNLEAARETARQLRLRDIGGIIVVDFIDMQDERNKKKVYDEMKKEFRKDRAKSSILPLTDFGIMQITRQRIRQSIMHSLSEQCPVCGGTGLLVSKTTIIKQIERWLERFRAENRERKLLLTVNPTLAEMLTSGLMSPLRNIQLKYLMRIQLQTDETLTGDEFRFFSPKQRKDITAEYQSNREAQVSEETLLEAGAPEPTEEEGEERRERRDARPPRRDGHRHDRRRERERQD